MVSQSEITLQSPSQVVVKESGKHGWNTLRIKVAPTTMGKGAPAQSSSGLHMSSHVTQEEKGAGEKRENSCSIFQAFPAKYSMHEEILSYTSTCTRVLGSAVLSYLQQRGELGRSQPADSYLHLLVNSLVCKPLPTSQPAEQLIR